MGAISDFCACCASNLFLGQGRRVEFIFLLFWGHLYFPLDERIFHWSSECPEKKLSSPNLLLVTGSHTSTLAEDSYRCDREAQAFVWVLQGEDSCWNPSGTQRKSTETVKWQQQCLSEASWSACEGTPDTSRICCLDQRSWTWSTTTPHSHTIQEGSSPCWGWNQR